MTLIDITPVIHESMAVFPGDQPFQREITLSFAKGDHLALSSIKTTLHIGAHADAPSHYHPHGVSIEKRSLDFYYGPCQVVDATGVKGSIGLGDISVPITANRVLFKTGSYHPQHWDANFTSLKKELIEWLASLGVVLIGIDTPSIDPSDSKDLEGHHAVFRHNLAILEGIVLNHVEPGEYILIAFPLAIAQADAAPVRAVLQQP